MKIFISPEPGQEIEDACLWISKDNAEAALALFESLSSAILRIPEFPGNCPLSPESKLGYTDEEVCQRLHVHGRTKYRVLFTTAESGITIIRVMHGARQYVGQEEPDHSK